MLDLLQTAYFVISEDAKHGEDLVCSYFACRNGGVKFRYCAYCMAPVAKRNFCRRHDHGMSKLKDGKVPDDDGNQSDSTSGSIKKEDLPSPQGLQMPTFLIERPKLEGIFVFDVHDRASQRAINGLEPPHEGSRH